MRLIVPARSNHLSADLARESYLRELHEAGGKVYLYQSAMLHAKAVVFDDQVAVIGSANMDNRSLFLNYEVAVFLYSRGQTAAISSWAKGSKATACESSPAGLGPRAGRERGPAALTLVMIPGHEGAAEAEISVRPVSRRAATIRVSGSRQTVAAARWEWARTP